MHQCGLDFNFILHLMQNFHCKLMKTVPQAKVYKKIGKQYECLNLKIELKKNKNIYIIKR